MLFFIGILSAMASPIDTISTVYKEGEFITSCTVSVNAGDSVGYLVTKEFDNQMRYNLDALFPWALKGLNLRKEKNELLEFYFKSTKFNKETGIIRGIGDVIIPNVITFPNIVI